MARKRRKQTPLELRLYVSAGTVVRLLELSESTVRNAIKRGTVDGFKIGRNWVVYRGDAERQWNGGRSFNWDKGVS